jgi:hypothetical protein
MSGKEQELLKKILEELERHAQILQDCESRLDEIASKD